MPYSCELSRCSTFSNAPYMPHHIGVSSPLSSAVISCVTTPTIAMSSSRSLSRIIPSSVMTWRGCRKIWAHSRNPDISSNTVSPLCGILIASTIHVRPFSSLTKHDLLVGNICCSGCITNVTSQRVGPNTLWCMPATAFRASSPRISVCPVLRTIVYPSRCG